MIITVTMNPAVDKTGELDDLLFILYVYVCTWLKLYYMFIGCVF